MFAHIPGNEPRNFALTSKTYGRNAREIATMSMTAANRGGTRASEFRARGDSCVDRALVATNPVVRTELMEMARQWHGLADEVEVFEAAARRFARERDTICDLDRPARNRSGPRRHGAGVTRN